MHLALAFGSLSCTEASCTEIGCSSNLDITARLADGTRLESAVSGTVTVDGELFPVDCRDGATPSPDVACFSGGFTLSLAEGVGGGNITVDLATDDGLSAAVARIPTWESAQPNGEDCPPLCWWGTVDVVLE